MTAIKSISECIAPWLMPIRKKEQNQNFLGQHEAKSREAGTAHRLLAKARERTLCQWEEQSKTVAVKSMVSGAMNYGPTTRIM